MMSDSADSSRMLWCLVHGHGKVFRVTAHTGSDIYDLKQIIQDQQKNSSLRNVDATDIMLWKLKNPIDITPIDSLVERIEELRNTVADFADELKEPAFNVSDVFPHPPARCLHIIVQPPSAGINDTGVMESIVPERLRQYRDFFIKIGEWGVFERADIRRNNIVRMCDVQEEVHARDDVVRMPTPNFVTNFERKLERKPLLKSNLIAYSDISGPYFDLPSVNPTTEDEAHKETRYAELLEVLHTGYHVAKHNWEKCWKRKPLKERAASSIFFDPLLYAPKEVGMSTVEQNQPFPFHLVLEHQGVEREHALRKYNPRNDLLIMRASLPRLLVQINSTGVQSWPINLIRMLLMGASVVRFANQYVNAFSQDKNFVLCAIFLRHNGQAIRYSMFQHHDGRVYYKEKRFSLNNPVGRVELTRLLYNVLFDVEVDEAQDSDTQHAIDQMIATVERWNLKSFHSDNTDNTAAGRKRHTDDRAGANEGDGNHEVLRAHGYEVKADIIVDDDGVAWEPLFKVPVHILTVFRPSVPSKEFIAKKVRQESHEFEIFEYLNTLQTKSDHIISLIDLFRGQSTCWLILPKLTTVEYYMEVAPKNLESNLAGLCFGLILGLAYLHEHGIAHRDIKPSNLLVDRDFSLKIIDFDNAMRVKDKDEEVDDCRGTMVWMAPEVKMKLRHSPIKADRWACGHIILFLLDDLQKEDKSLRAFAKELTVLNPKQRPCLVEWSSRSTPSLALLDTGYVGMTGQRTAKRHRQDPMEADGENAKVKKQRLDTWDRNASDDNGMSPETIGWVHPVADIEGGLDAVDIVAQSSVN